MPATVADVQIRSSLIDDYLQIADAPVAPGLAGRFLAVQDGSGIQPGTQLVTVPPEGGLVHFAPDSTSHSGWATTQVPVTAPGGATSSSSDRLAGFYAGGVLNVLAYFPSQTGGSVAAWMQRTPDAVWSQAMLTNDALNALGFTYQTDLYVDPSGVGYLYGVTGGLGQGGAFFLVAYDAAAGNWDIFYEQYLSDFDPPLSEEAAFRLMPGTGGAGFNVLWINGSTISFQGASIDDQGNFSWVGAAPQAFDPGVGTLSVDEVIALPGPLGTGNFLLRGGDGTLRFVAGYSDPSSATMTTLTGGDGQPAGATTGSVGLDAGGLLMVFAIEQGTQALWLQRQNGMDGSGLPTFDAWVQLGDALDTIACPAQMLAGPEVFTADLSQTVYHLAQAPTDLVWGTRKVAAPTPSTQDPQNIASYTLEVTAFDDQSNPVPSAVLQVTADQPTTIVSSGLSYQIGPNTPATLAATPSGSLAITIESASLSASTVTVAAADTGVSRWCQGDVVQVMPNDPDYMPPSQASVSSRLAGQDPNFPVTQSSLQSNGLIAPDYSGSDPVQAITNTGQWMQANPGSGTPTIDAARIAVPHWRIEFTAEGGPRYRALSEAEARSYLAGTTGMVAGIGAIFGDTAHFFKHAWQKLESFTATVVDGVLNVIFNDLPAFVVNTLREAASALETVFSTIMKGLEDVYDEIKKVVNWIKQLFDWDDILVTHEIIKYCVNDAFNKLPERVAGFQALVDGSFTDAETAITNYFNNLEQHFEPGASFNASANTLPPTQASGSGANQLDGTGATTSHAQNASNCNYVSSKSQAYYSGSNGAALTALRLQSGDTGLVDQINAAVLQNWPQNTLATNAQAVQAKVPSNPHSFFDAIVLDFLQAAKDLVLFVVDAAQAVFDAILSVTAQALQQLQGVLSHEIEIPIITWLYRQITKSQANPEGDQLTLLDLLCLAIAVPATIMYKVMFGHWQTPPFQPSDLQALQQQGLPWPSAPAASAAEGVQLDALPASLSTSMGVVASIAAFFGGITGATADALVFTSEPLPGFAQFISWTSVIQGSISQVAGAPWSTFGKAADTWNEADGWTTTLWATSWIPFIYDTAFTISTQKLARFSDLGPALDTGFGWVMTALGVVTLIEQGDETSEYSKWDQANSLIPQPARGFKFLAFSKDDPDPDSKAAAMAVLVAIDAVFGVGSLVTQTGATIADANAAPA